MRVQFVLLLLLLRMQRMIHYWMLLLLMLLMMKYQRMQRSTGGRGTGGRFPSDTLFRKGGSQRGFPSATSLEERANTVVRFPLLHAAITIAAAFHGHSTRHACSLYQGGNNKIVVWCKCVW